MKVWGIGNIPAGALAQGRREGEWHTANMLFRIRYLRGEGRRCGHGVGRQLRPWQEFLLD